MTFALVCIVGDVGGSTATLPSPRPEVSRCFGWEWGASTDSDRSTSVDILCEATGAGAISEVSEVTDRPAEAETSARSRVIGDSAATLTSACPEVSLCTASALEGAEAGATDVIDGVARCSDATGAPTSMWSEADRCIVCEREASTDGDRSTPVNGCDTADAGAITEPLEVTDRSEETRTSTGVRIVDDIGDSRTTPTSAWAEASLCTGSAADGDAADASGVWPEVNRCIGCEVRTSTEGDRSTDGPASAADAMAATSALDVNRCIGCARRSSTDGVGSTFVTLAGDAGGAGTISDTSEIADESVWAADIPAGTSARAPIVGDADVSVATPTSASPEINRCIGCDVGTSTEGDRSTPLNIVCGATGAGTISEISALTDRPASAADAMATTSAPDVNRCIG